MVPAAPPVALAPLLPPLPEAPPWPPPLEPPVFGSLLLAEHATTKPTTAAAVHAKRKIAPRLGREGALSEDVFADVVAVAPPRSPKRVVNMVDRSGAWRRSKSRCSRSSDCPRS
jgi:hypothetical protein